MVHCQVCGRALGWFRTLGCLVCVRGFVYPFRRVDGSRVPQRVRWICGRCHRRAARRLAELHESPPSS